MSISLFTRPTPPRRTKVRTWNLRPMIDGLEERTVLSTPGVAPPAEVAAVSDPSSSLPIQINKIDITSITRNADGTVTAAGTLAGTLLNHAFNTAFSITSTPPSQPGTCPVLDLHLGAINLDLLGLNVQTSPICLTVTAHSGPGNLLGNLLCNVGGLLDNANLNNVSGLTNSVNNLLNNSPLLGGLDNLLNDVTNLLGSPTSLSQVSVAGTNGLTCNVLNLSVAPVDLNLLGLEVYLDNCSNGPVTVTITGQTDEVLGGLICDVANLLNSGGTLDQILGDLSSILTGIGNLPAV